MITKWFSYGFRSGTYVLRFYEQKQNVQQRMKNEKKRVKEQQKNNERQKKSLPFNAG